MADEIRLGRFQILRVRTSTPELLEVESTWVPGDPPQRHFHPSQTERFAVHDGDLTVELDGRLRVLHAGDSVEILPGMVHRIWNAGSSPTHATWKITPALKTEDLFHYIAAGLTPMRTSRMLWKFRHEFRVPASKS